MVRKSGGQTFLLLNNVYVPILFITGKKFTASWLWSESRGTKMCTGKKSRHLEWKVLISSALTTNFCDLKNMKWRWLFHQAVVGKKIWFFRPPMMSFAFLGMIFGGKGLQIDTYKHPKCIWSYHTHVVNTSWPKWSKRPKFTFLSNFDVKNSIKSSQKCRKT